MSQLWWFGLVFVVFHCRNAIDSSLFKQWLHNLQSEIGILANGTLALRQVLIQGVDMFGKRIGFLKFKADIYKPVPGIVFARGPAVTVLILLELDGETYAVLTEQARVPTGRIILELPTGMLDDDKGDFVGTAVREVEEETGIKFKLEDMVDLTNYWRLTLELFQESPSMFALAIASGIPNYAYNSFKQVKASDKALRVLIARTNSGVPNLAFAPVFVLITIVSTGWQEI
ncbi:nudix hydrolase 14, chloroplastic-like [Arachis hypogaea]|uniref:nudix hydrolase 14, chloroplastic-like n=1 Tax=Arachis hypogaea TaxID=3818 RepID=UPI000DEC6A02|nr:nudix hydrolase 14, chloroplastic-like [Arachis hypogaea]